MGNSLRSQLDFFPDDITMLNEYVNSLNTVYGKVPYIKEEKNYFSVRLTSWVVVEDLNKLCNFSTKHWNFPSYIFENKKFVQEWIRAFFSAEAYVGPKRIKIQTVNQKGMKKLSTLLRKLGIDNKYYDFTPKK